MDLGNEQLGEEAVREPVGRPKSKDITNSKWNWENAGTRYQVYATIAIAVGVAVAVVYDHFKEPEFDPYAPAVTAPKSTNQH
ncbi:MAG: hypothetical protein WC843_05845 [Candidatus Gracilibacteria bacterium]|jgi:hypothetical protein